MRNIVRISFLCLTWTACAFAQSTPVGMITRVQGPVKIFEPGSKSGRVAELADLLLAGTRVVSGVGANVGFIYCPDSIAGELVAGADAMFTASTVQVKGPGVKQSRKIPSCKIPAAAAAGVSQRIGGVSLRGESSLRLFSPAGTKVMNKDFEMRWTKIDIATLYRVDLRDDAGNTVWEGESKANIMTYRAASLESGKEYRWRVTALQGEDVLASGSSWLKVASKEDVNHIEEMKAQSQKPGDSDPASHLLMGMYYEEMEMPDLALREYKQVNSATVGSWLKIKVRVLKERMNDSE